MQQIKSLKNKMENHNKSRQQEDPMGTLNSNNSLYDDNKLSHNKN